MTAHRSPPLQAAAPMQFAPPGAAHRASNSCSQTTQLLVPGQQQLGAFRFSLTKGTMLSARSSELYSNHASRILSLTEFSSDLATAERIALPSHEKAEIPSQDCKMLQDPAEAGNNSLETRDRDSFHPYLYPVYLCRRDTREGMSASSTSMFYKVLNCAFLLTRNKSTNCRQRQ